MSADLAARRLLSPDKANLVTTFEWAASQRQWATAARLLLRSFTVFHPYPIEGIELVDRRVAHLSAAEHDLAMRLISNQWTLHLLTIDGLLNHTIVLTIAGRPEGQASLEQAFEVQRKLAPGPDKTLAAVMCETFAGMVATQRGEPKKAIGHAAVAGMHQEELGFESEMSIFRWMTTVMGALMTGDPNAALKAADDYTAADSPFATGDEIRAIGQADMGHPDPARVAAQAHPKASSPPTRAKPYDRNQRTTSKPSTKR
jgi:hypothetical protein